MTATYTFDVFMSLDGFGGHTGDWGAYWGKQGPEFLEHRRAQYSREQRMVYGAATYRDFAPLRGADIPGFDEWARLMLRLPTTVVSSTLAAPLEWPGAGLVSGIEAVARLKEESGVPLRSHGSLALNRALLDAGLVDRVQVTVFPVVTGRTRALPVLRGVGDFDLELLESRTLDGNIHELVYRPTPHTANN
ncbi:dihydrofolate reductase family protein [Dactylosporangium sp. NPDC051541]|uniref:dihydrofolate reductase family protein n=1 Tax=Dactylosporangium sp. NPDC051541 TaxID=3363977 RepID=UPI0037AE4AB3